MGTCCFSQLALHRWHLDNPSNLWDSTYLPDNFCFRWSAICRP